MTSRPRTDQ